MPRSSNQRSVRTTATTTIGLTAAAGLALLVSCGLTRALLRAQIQAPVANLKFEVASVKPNTSGDFRTTMQVLAGGRFTATNVPALSLIRYAYQRQDFQLAGSPRWAENEDRFDIAAKAEGDAAVDQIRLMIQTLLADRFKFIAHHETRELPLYALVVSRSDGRLGPQLRRATADCLGASAPSPGPFLPPTVDRSCGFIGAGPGTALSSGRSSAAFRGVTMEGFARFLAPALGRGVIDKTGLTGYFDGDFDSTIEFGPPPPPPGVPDPFDRQAFPTIFTVVQEQLGLKLDSQKGPVDVLVIDRVEKPTAD